MRRIGSRLYTFNNTSQSAPHTIFFIGAAVINDGAAANSFSAFFVFSLFYSPFPGTLNFGRTTSDQLVTVRSESGGGSRWRGRRLEVHLLLSLTATPSRANIPPLGGAATAWAQTAVGPTTRAHITAHAAPSFGDFRSELRWWSQTTAWPTARGPSAARRERRRLPRVGRRISKWGIRITNRRGGSRPWDR